MPSFSESKGIELFIEANSIIRINLGDEHNEGIFSIYNMNGQLIYQSKINDRQVYYNMINYPAGTFIIDVRTNRSRETLLFTK
ncbi:MAG: T9SS type A sorting domain-containing protein [Bacteroidales bacterium]|nr:T9SS type A sorting domain-containing protein [Bacteroidales bacterium]